MSPATPLPSDSTLLAELRASGLSSRERTEELASQPIPWLWRPFVVAGTIALVTGSPSGGKTTLLFCLATLRASLPESPGGSIDFLGHALTPAPVHQVVVLIEGEHSEASAARKWVRCCRSLNVPVPDGRMIVLAREQVKVNSPKWQKICELVRRGLVSDIILDTLASTTEAEANDEGEQAKLFQTFTKVIRSSSACSPLTIWLAAHTRKDNAEGLGGVSGSAQRVAQSDTVLRVKSHVNPKTNIPSHATLEIGRVKEDAPDGESRANFDYVISPSKGAVRRASQATGASGRPALVDRATLLAFLRARPGEEFSRNKLAAQLNGGREEVAALLEELTAAKEVSSRLGTVAGNETTIYRARGPRWSTKSEG